MLAIATQGDADGWAKRIIILNSLRSLATVVAHADCGVNRPFLDRFRSGREKADGKLRLRIADSRNTKEHWPIGWPPKAAAGETVPELFKFLNVEITDFSLGETLTAIGGRVKVRFEPVGLFCSIALPAESTFIATSDAS